MTDPLPTFPLSQPPPLANVSSHAIHWIFVLLLITAATGCSDSRSGNFVEFSDLTQAVEPAEPEESLARKNDAGLDSVVEISDGAATTPPDDSIMATVNTVAMTGVAETDVAETDVAETDVAAQANAEQVESKEPKSQPIKLLIPHRKFRKEGNALRVSFDDIDLLKVLNMDPVPSDAADHFPDWLKQLNGAHVRIRGYMRPGFETEDITQFLFVRDNGECCYGPMPKIYDMIAVELAEGESTDLIEGTPFDVEGTLRIDPQVDEVELYALFFIDNGVIIE